MKLRVTFAGRVLPDQGLPAELDLPSGACIDDALAALQAKIGDRTLSPAWLVIVNGAHLGTVARHAGRTLRDGDELLLLAPVAGG